MPRLTRKTVVSSILKNLPGYHFREVFFCGFVEEDFLAPIAKRVHFMQFIKYEVVGQLVAPFRPSR